MTTNPPNPSTPSESTVQAFADIPRPGAAIEKGWPVLTILARGSSPEEVRERLQSRAAELDQLLADASP